MELLRSPYHMTLHLRRMARYGILGRYLPEFGQITGQMQHDLFHIYTVDAHTLQVVENMRRLYRPEAEESYRSLQTLQNNCPNPNCFTLPDCITILQKVVVAIILNLVRLMQKIFVIGID